MQNSVQIGSVIAIKELSNEKFVIGRILRGGMGEVYQLIPVAFGGSVMALKTYQSSVVREEFIREADIWISLGSHPHIARAILYLEWLSKPSIISYWYEQAITSEVVKQWPTSQIINFAVGLIDGLDYAFSVGRIIHQDVKPANILIDEGGNPRITDFGLARFAGLSRAIPSFAEVDASMVNPVTLGPIGGTPFYMAPELFGGQKPSLQTDIFSLGVTLYEILTGEHPYCGPETGNRLRPTLRSGPLMRVQKARGTDCVPLLSAITSALHLDPRKRAASYDSLVMLLGGKPSGNYLPVNSPVIDLLAKAAFFRETGRPQESLNLLETALRDRPSNPAILNSYAIQLLKLGSKQKAYSAWGAAVESLIFTKGRHDHAVYPDPAVNLAWRKVAERQFKEADELLRLVEEWCKESRYILSSYMELGWRHLFNGRFEDAWRHLVICCGSKDPDEMSVWSLTLAAWLSGEFAERADTLARIYPKLGTFGATTALLACTIATFLPKPEQEKLRALAYPKFEGELRETAKEIGLNPPTFLQTLSEPKIHLIIRSLDAIVTGGKNVERV